MPTVNSENILMNHVARNGGESPGTADLKVAALYTVTSNWKQSQCPSAGEQIDKVVHQHNRTLIHQKKRKITNMCYLYKMSESQEHYTN